MNENIVEKVDPNNKPGWKWHAVVMGSFFFLILTFLAALFFLIDPDWAYEIMHSSAVGPAKGSGR